MITSRVYQLLDYNNMKIMELYLPLEETCVGTIVRRIGDQNAIELVTVPLWGPALHRTVTTVVLYHLLQMVHKFR